MCTFSVNRDVAVAKFGCVAMSLSRLFAAAAEDSFGVAVPSPRSVGAAATAAAAALCPRSGQPALFGVGSGGCSST